MLIHKINSKYDHETIEHMLLLNHYYYYYYLEDVKVLGKQKIYMDRDLSSGKLFSNQFSLNSWGLVAVY